MFRLTALLCGTIFLAMLIGGQDRGQQRFGLMAVPEDTTPLRIAAESLAEAASNVTTQAVSYVPEKPLIVQAVETPEPTPAAAGRVLFVSAASANVRKGPGKDHAVLGRLTRNEAVLEVVAGAGPDGWSLVRIEGDGIEGYVATRLLRE
jgi:uncharacterized protein YgiM (DUF1202 family)